MKNERKSVCPFELGENYAIPFFNEKRKVVPFRQLLKSCEHESKNEQKPLLSWP
jgi:hypothetical protein